MAKVASRKKGPRKFRVGDRIIVEGSEWANGPGVIMRGGGSDSPEVRFDKGATIPGSMGGDAGGAHFYIDKENIRLAPAKATSKKRGGQVSKVASRKKGPRVEGWEKVVFLKDAIESLPWSRAEKTRVGLAILADIEYAEKHRGAK